MRTILSIFLVVLVVVSFHTCVQATKEVNSLKLTNTMQDSIINLQDTLIQKAFDHDNDCHNCDQPWMDDNEIPEIEEIKTRIIVLTSKCD